MVPDRIPCLYNGVLLDFLAIPVKGWSRVLYLIIAVATPLAVVSKRITNVDVMVPVAGLDGVPEIVYV